MVELLYICLTNILRQALTPSQYFTPILLKNYLIWEGAKILNHPLIH